MKTQPSEKINPYAVKVLPTHPALLLSTSAADYYAHRETIYTPITGGVHVRRVSIERVDNKPQQTD